MFLETKYSVYVLATDYSNYAVFWTCDQSWGSNYRESCTATYSSDIKLPNLIYIFSLYYREPVDYVTEFVHWE